MTRNPLRTVSAFLLPAALLLAGCGGSSDAASGSGTAMAGDTLAPSAASFEEAAPVAAPQVAQGPTSGLPANELGEIMVLEYHRIGENEGEWVRSRANFQKDLETLYEKGYRPVTMRQVVEGNIDVPAGTTPVVFTIDDSSRGQFYYREDGSIDPNTMAGMWDAFQRRNPEWHHGAVWCVLPAADHPSNFFGAKPSREMPRAEREADIRRKMEYLVQNRHEICNHTLYHARLDRARDDAQVQEWLGVGEDSIKAYLPADYDIVTHALPLGMWPKNRSLAWSGTYRNGKRYEYKAVLEVSGGPSVSPWDRRFNPRSVNRFIVAPGALERQLRAYEANPGRRYVSDGDPSTVAYPASAAAQLDRSRLNGKRAVEVAEAAPAPAAPGGT